MTTIEKLLDGKLVSPIFPVAFYPPVSDRKSWENAVRTPGQKQVADYVIRSADILLSTQIPPILFMDYTSFKRDGDRVRLQDVYYWRRNGLGILACACALTGDVKKYLPGVLNFLWCILEERYWCLHAHAVYFADENPYPDDRKTRKRVDLFAAATGMLFALVMNLCGEEIRKRYPEFDRVIRSEVRERLILPLLDRGCDELHWWKKGWGNWSTWIVSNTLITASCFAANPAEFQELLDQLVHIDGLYFDLLSEDGYCDEGPSYWGKAGRELLLFFGHLDRIFPGVLATIKGNLKFKAAAEFPAKAAYSDEYSVNFGDAQPRLSYAPQVLAQFGKWFNSPLLESYARAKYDRYIRDMVRVDVSIRPGKPLSYFTCGEVLMEFCSLFFDLPEDFQPNGAAFQPAESVFYPGRLGIVRNSVFTATLKGGHNHENHNHNDLGQFTLFRNGVPVIVDLGTEVYTAKTFAEHRYDSLFQGAQGHNAPIFNGIRQQFGTEYTASLVMEKDTLGEKVLSSDLSKAYPTEAGIKSLIRTLTLTDRECRISDRCTGATTPAVITLFTPQTVKKEGNNLRVGEDVLLDLTPFVKTETEPFPCQDRLIVQSWGEHLTKIVLTADSLEYDLVFRQRPR